MKVDPLRVLMARAQARALLFNACAYETMNEAVEPLLRYAYYTRLIDHFGEAVINTMIEKAFADCRCEDQADANGECA